MKNGLIAYSGRDQIGHQNIFLTDEGSSYHRQITFGPDNACPSWSPDGKMLAYVARAPASKGTRVCVMNADGSNAHPITDGNTPEWSPDGKLIAYTDQQEYGVSYSNIWTIRPDGTKRVKVTYEGLRPLVKPTWSPDGKILAYVRHGLDHVAIWVKARRLTTSGWVNLDAEGKIINSADDANSPSWGRNNKIAFWSGIERGNGQIWTIEPDGTARTQLTHAPLPSRNDDPSCSPDGRILFTTDRSGKVEMWCMNADGSNQHRITENTAGPLPGYASWQPIP